jgi:hypothetical protein
MVSTLNLLQNILVVPSLIHALTSTMWGNTASLYSYRNSHLGGTLSLDITEMTFSGWNSKA